jgi:hypothetical protein
LRIGSKKQAAGARSEVVFGDGVDGCRGGSERSESVARVVADFQSQVDSRVLHHWSLDARPQSGSHRTLFFGSNLRDITRAPGALGQRLNLFVHPLSTMVDSTYFDGKCRIQQDMIYR